MIIYACGHCFFPPPLCPLSGTFSASRLNSPGLCLPESRLHACLHSRETRLTHDRSPATMSSSSPPVPLTPASLCWSSLQLLGFDAGVQAAKWRAEIGIGMFDKPNAKAMQIVLHFLLMNIKKCTTSEQHNASPEWKDITNVRTRASTEDRLRWQAGVRSSSARS